MIEISRNHNNLTRKDVKVGLRSHQGQTSSAKRLGEADKPGRRLSHSSSGQKNVNDIDVFVNPIHTDESFRADV